MAFSGRGLAVTNCTAESQWLILVHVWPEQIVLPSLGGSFWLLLAVTIRASESWWLFLAYCRVLVAFCGPLLAARTAESW